MIHVTICKIWEVTARKIYDYVIILGSFTLPVYLGAMTLTDSLLLSDFPRPYVHSFFSFSLFLVPLSLFLICFFPFRYPSYLFNLFQQDAFLLMRSQKRGVTFLIVKNLRIVKCLAEPMR